jgi:peroxiredoxin
MRHVIFILLCFATAACQSRPQLSLKDMEGKVHSLSDYRGKIVVLNFWATWCVPCRDEMPIFVEAQKKFGQRNLVILAASLDDARTQQYVRKFVKTYKMDFPVLLDASAELMAQFGLGETVPSTIFLDTQGNIVDKIQGQARRKDLLSRLGRLFVEQDAPAKAASQPTPQKTPPPSAAP